MEHKPVSADDIVRVKSYMYQHHCGFVRAVPRQSIAQALGYEDRKFREICAEIPEIITSTKFGYYCLPLCDTTGLEVKRAKEIVEGEDRRRMIALYLRQRRQRKAIRTLAEKSGAEKQEAWF